LPGELSELGDGAIPLPNAPLGSAGGGHQRGAQEADLVRIRVPAPHFQHLAGKKIAEGVLFRIAGQVDGVPPALEKIAGAGPLGVGSGGKQQAAERGKERFHRTERR
jgi:hypothetical protein